MLTFADRWDYVVRNMAINAFNVAHVNFYGRSDADMLEVGNKNLTEPQERSHFAIWAAMKSPLMLGFDLLKVEKRAIDIVTNKHLIEFNQDPVIGEAAKPFKWDRKVSRLDKIANAPQYWAGRYSNKRMVWLFNKNATSNKMTFQWADTEVLETSQWYKLTDAWEGKPLGCFKDSYTTKQELVGWDTAVLIVQNAIGPC
jgi:alpha-galactosidase